MNATTKHSRSTQAPGRLAGMPQKPILELRKAQARVRELVVQLKAAGAVVPPIAAEPSLAIIMVNKQVHALETALAQHRARSTPAVSGTATPTAKPQAPAVPDAEVLEREIRRVQCTGVANRRLARAIATERLRRSKH